MSKALSSTPVKSEARYVVAVIIVTTTSKNKLG